MLSGKLSKSGICIIFDLSSKYTIELITNTNYERVQLRW